MWSAPFIAAVAVSFVSIQAPTPRALTRDEARVLRIARLVVAERETRAMPAASFLPRRRPNGGWSVYVTPNNPRALGSGRLILLDRYGRLTAYLRDE